MREPSLGDIREAHKRILPYIHRTPVMTSSSLNEFCNAEVFLKSENFQKAGAFKIRGATNAVFSLSEEEASRGVATHSSGNHGAALALAARWRGIRAHVVMPSNAPTVKKDAVAGYGAEILFCEPTLKAREEALKALLGRTGAVFVHPYNDPRIIAGQGTAAMELLEQVPDLDLLLAPVGGGGLLSGTAIVVHHLSPGTRVVGAEPEGADDAYQSFLAGTLIPSTHPTTIADGLLTSLGDLTFSVIRKYVQDIYLASEDMIVAAMRYIWERMKMIIEPSSAVPIAAILNRGEELSGKRIGVVVSGGNVDLATLPWCR